jgi:diguanylate cyclase (GGDEF)-like protein
MTQGSRQIHRTWRELWDPWLLPVAATPLLGVAFVSDGRDATRAPAALMAMVLLLATVGVVAFERLRSNAVEMVLESAIGTAALAFLAWGLGLSRPVESGSGRSTALLASVSTVVGIAALVSIAWLASVDKGARRISLLLLAAASLSLAVASTATAEAATDGAWPQWIADLSYCGAIVLGGAAVAHHSRRQLRMPALDLEQGHVARRAAVTLGAVLVGPLLLVIPAAADSLSLPFVAAITVVLTSLAVAHVFRLLQRWGALEHDVFHDALTGLPNRQYFNQRLHVAIEHARGDGSELAVLFLDLDNFKQVNDHLGHSAGNQLLVTVAARLRNAADDGTTVARLSGDEFAMLVPLPRGRGATRDAKARVLEGFAAPFDVAHRLLYVTPSIGVAHFPADGRDASELLEHADAAMYRMKSRRRATRSDHAPALPTEPTLDIELALRRAINEDRLVLHYQPKVDLLSGRVAGVEALLRWRHPAGGLLLPDAFLPIAEENGLMPAITEWVLLEACAQSRRWIDGGVGEFRVAVNLSPSQLGPNRMPELVERVLRFTKLPPELLELEVNERATLLEPRALHEDIDALRELGIRCVIDDFGGAGRLDYLDRIEVDALELHRRHASSITASGSRVVDAALAVGRALGIETVVEGIETAEQLDFLRAAGARGAQGYLLAPPAPSDEIEPVLRGLALGRRRPDGDEIAS